VKSSGANTLDLERAVRDGMQRASAPPPRRPPTNRVATAPVKPETVIVREQAPLPKVQPKPDSNKVEVFRGNAKEEKKFARDSVRRDTIPNN
jgi:hypothetical protein